MEMHPEKVLVAVKSIYPDLPSLLRAEAWQQISAELDAKITQLEAGSAKVEQLQAATDLVGLLAPYQAARERLRVALQALDVRSEVLMSLAELAEQVGRDTYTSHKFRQSAGQPAAGGTRLVILSAGGARAKSVKLGNLQFDFGAAAELAAGVLAMISEIAGKQDHLMLAAGVLLLLRGLEKMNTVALSEREATVFWGFVLACDQEKQAGERAILRYSNQERAKVGLEELSLDQLKNALFNLALLKSVTRVPAAKDKWRMVERYVIKHWTG